MSARRSQRRTNAAKRASANAYLETLRKQRGLAPIAPVRPCSKRREGDEFACGGCPLRWDAHEERPACPRGQS